jgi:hypothetical protein
MLRGSPLARRALVALAFALATPAAAAELVPVALESLRGQLGTQVPHAFTRRGIELTVDGNQPLTLPFAAQAIELDVEAGGPVLLTWTTQTPGKQPRPFGPPWRHVTLPRTRSAVVLDLRITEGWSASAQPMLILTGAGLVVIHGIRVLPIERDPAVAAAEFDRARFWAPESIGHATINFLTPSYWSASRGTWLSDVVAAVAVAAFAAAVAFSWYRRRRPGLARALAAAAVVAAGLWNLHLLVRFLPAFHLRPTPDVEARIRENYDMAPDVGALAALARAQLGPRERVGTLSVPKGWFAPQTLCFNLFPRRCVVLSDGSPGPEHTGISGVQRLREDEVDAIVAYRAAVLPPGWVPVAGFGSSTVIARRRP